MGELATEMNASILVATYEHPDFLRRTLLGFSRQTVQNFELIVCDDGSGPEIERVISGFLPRFSGRLTHCKHAKSGFRKCRILNEGILKTRTDYLVFIDADCIPHSRFMEEHLLCRASETYLVGRRVQLGEKLTAQLADDDVASGRLESVWWTLLPWLLRGQIRHMEAGIYLSSDSQTNGSPKAPPLKGCNFSCWKSDMTKINGFNEDFVAPGGGEDDDIDRRLRLIGLRGKSVKNAAICYHQYHKLVPRGATGGELCRLLAEQGIAICERGLRQHR
jgi:glycosyltransferase involved in cell wall biosynthesis